MNSILFQNTLSTNNKRVRNTYQSTTHKTVVLLISKLRIGGAEQFVITLAKSLKKLGHNPHIVLLYNHITLPVPSNIPVHIFNYSKFRRIPKSMRQLIVPNALDNFIEKKIGKPDLVLSNLLSSDKFMAHSKLENTYLIVHNTLSKKHKINNRNLKILKKTYLNKPCVGVSHGVSKDLIDLLGDDVQITTIYDPVDIDKINNLANAFIPPFKNYIVNVGSFKEAKRQDILLRAYKESGISNELVLVGDGDKRKEIESLANKLRIQDKVHFVGSTENPYPYIKHALTKIISSDYEGLNIAMLEAIALGVPVISTDCPSGPSEVLPNKNLSPVGNVSELAKNIQNVIKKPDSFVINLDKDFYPDVAAKKYLELIEI